MSGELPPPPPPPDPPSSPDQVTRLLVLGGAGLIAVAAFMPWATMTAPLFGRASLSGIEGDGVLTLFLAVPVIMLGWPAVNAETISRTRAAWILVLGVLAAVITGNALYNLSGDAGFGEVALTQVGVGLWLTAVGTIMVATGGLRELLE